MKKQPLKITHVYDIGVKFAVAWWATMIIAAAGTFLFPLYKSRVVEKQQNHTEFLWFYTNEPTPTITNEDLNIMKDRHRL